MFFSRVRARRTTHKKSMSDDSDEDDDPLAGLVRPQINSAAVPLVGDSDEDGDAAAEADTGAALASALRMISICGPENWLQLFNSIPFSLSGTNLFAVYTS